MNLLSAALADVRRLSMDTSPFIYLVEANPKYGSMVKPIFQRIDHGDVFAVASIVTLCEVLVHPLRRGDVNLQWQYRTGLLRASNIGTVPVSESISERAANLRARFNLRTPDALKIATALEMRSDASLTNDVEPKRVTELPVLVLDELRSDNPDDVPLHPSPENAP